MRSHARRVVPQRAAVRLLPADLPRPHQRQLPVRLPRTRSLDARTCRRSVLSRKSAPMRNLALFTRVVGHEARRGLHTLKVDFSAAHRR